MSILNQEQYNTLFESINKHADETGVSYYTSSANFESVVSALDAYSFPKLCTYGSRVDQKAQAIATAGFADDQMIGLVVSTVDEEDTLLEVRSFWTNDEEMAKTVVPRLFQLQTEFASTKNLQRIQMTYRSEWKVSSFLQSIFKVLGWRDKDVLHYFFEFPNVYRLASLYRAFYKKRKPVPEGYSIELWTPENVEQLKTQIPEGHPIRTSDISPFQNPGKFGPNASRLVLYRGRIVGWLLMHRLREDVLQATAFYIERGHPKGLAMRVIEDQFKFNDGFKYKGKVIFMVRSSNKYALRLVRFKLLNVLPCKVTSNNLAFRDL